MYFSDETLINGKLAKSSLNIASVCCCEIFDLLPVLIKQNFKTKPIANARQTCFNNYKFLNKDFFLIYMYIGCLQKRIMLVWRCIILH